MRIVEGVGGVDEAVTIESAVSSSSSSSDELILLRCAPVSGAIGGAMHVFFGRRRLRFGCKAVLIRLALSLGNLNVRGNGRLSSGIDAIETMSTICSLLSSMLYVKGDLKITNSKYSKRDGRQRQPFSR